MSNPPRFAKQAPLVPTAAWLRQRLAGPRQLKAVEEDAVPQDLTLAAVLVPIVERPEGLTVLLTQRTVHLNDHAGQVSFPGGRCVLTDASPVFTALRETEEEIGLDGLPGLLPWQGQGELEVAGQARLARHVGRVLDRCRERFGASIISRCGPLPVKHVHLEVVLP